MKQIFVNLKRFEVSRRLGGVCDFESPTAWLEWVLQECLQGGLGCREDMKLIFLLPEALVCTAVAKLERFAPENKKNVYIGCQGVYREDIKPQGNFGAFTTNCPATAAKAIGCAWTIVGHSEERKDKLGVIQEFLKDDFDMLALTRAQDTVSRLVRLEVAAALEAGLKVLFCLGETEQERGNGSEQEQQERVRDSLKKQLELGLEKLGQGFDGSSLAIAYEPIWAIGPGKIPPGKEYIAFVSAYIKEAVKELYGFVPTVVYGGGLKEENAAMIAGIDTLDGGLVALTRFTGEIGFYPSDLQKIIGEYQSDKGRSA